MKIFKPSAAEAEFSEKMKQSFQSVKVVGRGTVVVDVQEVQASDSFGRNLARGRRLVEAENDRPKKVSNGKTGGRKLK